jgi:hypothetical protein
MRAAVCLAILGLVLVLSRPCLAEQPAVDLMSVDRLQPLPLSFWNVLAQEKDGGEAVRTAYLRGFFEATEIWAGVKPQETNTAYKYLRVLQGMNLVQVSNLVSRVWRDYPQYRDRLSLSQVMAACLIRARAGEGELIDDKLATEFGLKGVAPKKP